MDYYDATYMATKDIRKAMNREISEDKLSALEESYYTACTNYLTNYMKGEAVNAEDWAAYKSRISAIGLLVDHGYEPPTIQYLAESETEKHPRSCRIWKKMPLSRWLWGISLWIILKPLWKSGWSREDGNCPGKSSRKTTSNRCWINSGTVK